MLGGYLEQRENIYCTTYGLKYIIILHINIGKIQQIQQTRRFIFARNNAEEGREWINNKLFIINNYNH